ncbi:MBL fold metallo-hydrolase [Microtetraspora sp. AC03309]|uniref:MBL fold metallo-hydrolase n=1 Tax=Microtetraspora sp. AC03309 TaxID=2779376 RepID=UPI001E5B6F25|nr:MBL fold metallo-hydrolase [Microtetraspora sp. AC03309]
MIHISGRVWLYPADPDPASVQGSVAVIADDAGSVVVDAGHSPDLARRVQAAMIRAGLPPARRLVYTHHHWDHTWGACAWDGVEVVGHETGRALMEAEARRPWSHAYLREQIAENPRLEPSFGARARAMDSWEGFRLVPAHTTFTDRLSLPGGIEVRHVGGHHAPDSIVVAVPDSSVMLLGDCFYPPPYHLRVPGDEPDLAQLGTLVDEGFEWYVDSHDTPWRNPHLPR